MKLGKKLSTLCIALLAAFSLLICSVPVSAATTAPAKSQTSGSVTAKVLNVRSGPGKTYKKVGTLKKGSKVTVISMKSGWKKIKYKNQTAYVYAKYIKAMK